MTECNQSSFGFEACGSREIVARFDGGTISSDGGAFLLRQTDQRLNLLPRLAQCFLDGRNQKLVEHSNVWVQFSVPAPSESKRSIADAQLSALQIVLAALASEVAAIKAP